MKLDVRLFARAADLAGADAVTVDVPESATVAELRAALAGQLPELAPLVPKLFVSVDAEFADDARSLHDTQAIACFPPVSGG